MTNEYLKVANGDAELMGNVVHQMRGHRTVPDYSMDCGYAGRTLTRITGNERKSDISEKMMSVLYENRDPESIITDDNVLAANGCIKTEYLDAMRRKMVRDGVFVVTKMPEMGADIFSDHGDGCFSLCTMEQPVEFKAKTKKRRGRKLKVAMSMDTMKVVENMEKTLTEKERKADSYVAFLWDLAKFSLALSAKEYNVLRYHVRRLSEDAFFCAVLHDYCELVEYDDAHDMEKLRKFFNGERADVPEWAEESKDCFDVLYDLLFVFDRNYLG